MTYNINDFRGSDTIREIEALISGSINGDVKLKVSVRPDVSYSPSTLSGKFMFEFSYLYLRHLEMLSSWSIQYGGCESDQYAETFIRGMRDRFSKVLFMSGGWEANNPEHIAPFGYGTTAKTK